ncbi:hypothetical protein CN918_30645 [Priestia megaterium]|nr:hypothetical protein CN918_30645 [Priestia megaterium]
MKKTMVAITLLVGLVGCGNEETSSSPSKNDEKTETQVESKEKEKDVASATESKTEKEDSGSIIKQKDESEKAAAESKNSDTSVPTNDKKPTSDDKATSEKKTKYARTEININDTNPYATEKDLIDTLRQEVFGPTEEAERIGSRIVSFERVDGHTFNIETDKRLIKFMFYPTLDGWKIKDLETGEILLSSDGIEDFVAESEKRDKELDGQFEKDEALAASVEQMLLFEMETRYDLIGDKIVTLEQKDGFTFYVKTNTRELKVTVLNNSSTYFACRVQDWNTGESLFRSET